MVTTDRKMRGAARQPSAELLGDTAQHLAAETRLLAETSRGRAPNMPAALAQEMSALREDIAAARAMTAGPGDPGVGDAGLWEYLGPAPSC